MTDACGSEVCVTCADELLRAVVEEVDGGDVTARVRTQTQVLEVSIELLDDIRVGDVLLVHGGVALQRIEDDR